MINVTLQVPRWFLALEIVLWIYRLSQHFEAVELVVDVQPAPVHVRAIRELHRGAVDSPQVLGRDSNIAVLYQFVPGRVQLRPWGAAKGIRVRDLVREEPLRGL